MSAVVALSSTGDAACGLHKQRLRHTGFPRGWRRQLRDGDEVGGVGSGGRTGSERNVPTPRCIQPPPPLLAPFVHPQQRETPRRSARHLSPPYSQAGSFLPASPASCRRVVGGGIRRALKDAPGAKRQRARPFPTRQPTDGSLPVRITPLSP